MKTEEAIFLDDTLSELKAFFSDPKNANERYWANCARIKQIDDLHRKHWFSDIGSEADDLMKTLYIRGYYSFVDYYEGDFFVFTTEKALHDFLCDRGFDYIDHLKWCINPEGILRKVIIRTVTVVDIE